MIWNRDWMATRNLLPAGVTERNGVRVNLDLAAKVREAKEVAGQVIPKVSPLERLKAIRAIEPTLPEIAPETVETMLLYLNGRDGPWSYELAEELAKTVLAAEQYAQSRLETVEPAR